jgi:hypothetical protein
LANNVILLLDLLWLLAVPMNLFCPKPQDMHGTNYYTDLPKTSVFQKYVVAHFTQFDKTPEKWCMYPEGLQKSCVCSSNIVSFLGM